MSTPIQLPLEIIARTARRLGMDVGRWSPSNAEIPPVASHAVVHPLVEHLKSQRPDEPLGVRLGIKCRPVEFGLPSLIARHSPTLRDAVEKYLYFQTLAAPGCSRLKRASSPPVDTLIAPSPPLDPTLRSSLGFRCVFPMVFAVQNLRRLAADRAVVAEEVTLMQPDDGFGANYEEYFGGPVRFDSDENSLRFAPGVLDRPTRGADPAVVPYLEKLAIQEAQQFGLRPGRGESFVGFLRIKLREAIFDGDVELTSMAKRLGMSERTLQRRLSKEGLSYRDLVDDVRKKLALELMRAAEHTLQDIAFRLGYSHLASFNRAFKRWTGRSPGEYRDELSYAG